MIRKTPSIDWKTGTETIDDVQISYISKGVSYDNNYGVCLFVGRRTDDPTPREFTYIFELDIDPAKDMTVCFQKRGRYMAGFSYLLNPKAVEEGHLAIVLPNIVDLPKSSCKLNLFEAHIKSDTAVFGYTSVEGKQKEFRFPLTGFNEKYLEQFI